jgi:hypothetical protein
MLSGMLFWSRGAYIQRNAFSGPPSRAASLRIRRHTTYDRAMALIASIARNETYIEVHATANCYCKCLFWSRGAYIQRNAFSGPPSRAASLRIRRQFNCKVSTVITHSVGCRPRVTRIAFRITLEWHQPTSSIVITQASICLFGSPFPSSLLKNPAAV